ncbi:hypothetical protein O988_09436 [Pseudogymnoascus sp. VKM F-3808]|nr:hypothetical protein O988_09436 [Pseudogymnoascus sp. VKM F-3808]
MGTRHLICVFYRGRFVVAQYGQWDGYPEVQGVKVLAFLRSTDNIEKFKQGLEHTYTPTDAEVEEFEQAVAKLDQEFWAAPVPGKEFDRKRKSVCPSLSRDTSAEILEVVAHATAGTPVPIRLGLEFIYDGLFCEWVYVVDLDAEVLEVFNGIEEEYEGSSQRFKGVPGAVENEVPSLLKAYSFTGLPTTDDEFLADMKVSIEQRRERQKEARITRKE